MLLVSEGFTEDEEWVTVLGGCVGVEGIGVVAGEEGCSFCSDGCGGSLGSETAAACDEAHRNA